MMTWRLVIRSRRYRWAMVFCLGMISLMVFYMPTFYEKIIQPKPGLIFDDVILNALTPFNFSLPIFLILYLTLIHTVYSSIKNPDIIVVGMTTYCAVNLIRMGTMHTLTLEPPPGMILLVDPIATFLVYPDSGFAKDLFFSGHVSSMMAMVLVEPNKKIKMAKILGTVVVGVFLAWQHVHYTLDLVVAPFVTYAVFTNIQRLVAKPEKELIAKPEKPLKP
jgi:PAP2 superfamily C-terminal